MTPPKFQWDTTSKVSPEQGAAGAQGDFTGHLMHFLFQSQQQMQQLFQAQQRSQDQMHLLIQAQQQAQQQSQAQTIHLLQEIKNQRDHEQQVLLNAIRNPASQPPPGLAGLNQASRSPTLVKLPKLQLPKFEGEILKWPNFWESFEINVDSQTQLSDKQKLDYLHQVLKGPAYDKIKGLGLEGNKYAEAVKILKEQYGDKMHQKKALWESLHSLRPVKENMNNLEKFTDEMNALTVALKKQGVPEMTDKLPKSLNSEINKMRLLQGKHKEELKMQELLDFLKNFQLLNIAGGNTGKKKESKEEVSGSNQQVQSKVPTANFAQNSTQVNKRGCLFCGKGNHWSDECQKVTDVQKRREMIKKEGRCFKCLNKGHLYKDCKRKKPCFHCKDESHNSALCLKRVAKQQMHLSVQTEEEEESNESETVQIDGFLTTSKENKGIVMATFPCEITNPVTKEKQQMHVFLDTGAKVTCISAEAAKRLKLKSKKQVTLETSRFNTKQIERINAGMVELELNGPKNFKIDVEAYTIPNMAPPIGLEAIHFDKGTWKKIQVFKPINNPPTSNKSTPIDIIIGMDYWYDVMGAGLPSTAIQTSLVVHHTPLGNILCGKFQKMRDSYPIENEVTIPSMKESQNEETVQINQMLCLSKFEDPVQKLWDLETIGIKYDDPEGSTKEQEVLQKFKETVQFENGRYVVGFPWKDDRPNLSSNFNTAKGRLTTTLKSLCPSGEPTQKFQKYNKIIKDQLDAGVIEEVKSKRPDGLRVHYIPHLAVSREDKATTKLRVVYDASAKTRNEGKSLNDMMYSGPCLLQNLSGILLRFRLPQVAIVSDIEKAFLQVGLRQTDRDATRFLWVKDDTKPTVEENIQVYRFTRIPFGVASSPYLLGATINFHLDKNPGKVASQIKNNVYVDNVVIGSNNTKEAVKLYKEAKELFQSASMNLREWVSNSEEFNRMLPDVDRVKSKEVSVLGILWNTQTDKIQLKVNVDSLHNVTKRSTLQQLAKIFDPLGYLSPVTIRGKILHQQMWKENFDWDCPLPDPYVVKWKALENELQSIKKFSVLRPVLVDHKIPIQLLCFTDSSQEAYSACVYVRQKVNSEVRCSLVFAKARVVPIKRQLTLPQLELTAALIGARALRFVERELNHPVEGKFLWSDSQIALHWIHSQKELPPYVARRTQEIVNKGDISFSYVNTRENPADLATRGVSANFLKESNWLTGPDWVTQDVNKWPKWCPVGMEEPLLPPSQSKGNRRKQKGDVSQEIHLMNSNKEMLYPFDIDVNMYSDVSKLLRVTAYCRRFVDRCLKKSVPETKAVTAKELQFAKHQWIRAVQQQSFTEELKLLKKGKRNQLIKQLDLFLDGSLVRCGGRLANANLKEESQYPTLLPRNNKLTSLVIEKAHEKVFHFGARSTLAEVRLSHWIPHGLTEVKSVLRKCLICRRVQGGPFKPPRMAQMPAERVRRAPAFKYTGLDYLGPLFIREKTGEEHQKRWIAIFTCFTTRAVHLEVIKDCSAESAVQAVERFIGRRGTPHTILTDNALQFKKGASILQAIWGQKPGEEIRESLTTFYSQQGIHWRYIPEKSPWVGGFYERLVDLVKRAIKKTLWKMTVTNEGLQTLIAQIEGTLNTRPLLTLSPDINDQSVLTPAGLMAPMSQLGMPPSEEDPDDPDYDPKPHGKATLLRQWKMREKKLDQFWKIWQTQYLQELREAHQTHFKLIRGEIPRLPQVGEVCLIRDTTPRVTWKMGKVLGHVHSADGEVRFVNIRLPSGFSTKRGVKDLVPLEADFIGTEDNQTTVVLFLSSDVLAPGDCRGQP
ncbi:hypothetical protein HOLleu_44067 [Holothuria leucospilota]|uniref:Uncharacterized protein n=1 Tax=Holothuria leucospilota TaxID=206669 RepID=A0A9Q0YDQ3_HOLLE|nr:hypothetical protein HOLleu_44067 [Holothuria leucospilota]